MANIDGPLGRPSSLPPALTFFHREEGFDILALSLQRTAMLKYTIMVPVGVKRLEDIVCYIANDRINLQPVVERFVLGMIELLYFLVLQTFDLEVISQYHEARMIGSVYYQRLNTKRGSVPHHRSSGTFPADRP